MKIGSLCGADGRARDLENRSINAGASESCQDADDLMQFVSCSDAFMEALDWGLNRKRQFLADGGSIRARSPSASPLEGSAVDHSFGD